jgi:hypothetical protein
VWFRRRKSAESERGRAYTSLVGPGPVISTPVLTALTMYFFRRRNNIVQGDKAKPSVSTLPGGFAICLL